MNKIFLEKILILKCPSFFWKDIREVIEMCLEEQNTENLNEFIGIRELEVVYGGSSPFTMHNS